MHAKLNLKLITWLLTVALILGIGIHYVHAYQVKRQAGALLRRAERAEAQGQLDRTASYLSQYVAFAPGDHEAMVRYGAALSRLAQSPKARVQALAVLEQILLTDPQELSTRRLAVGLALDLANFADARRHLDALHQAQPDDAEVEFLCGVCAEASGQYAEAADWYDKAIEHGPERIEIYVRLANEIGRASCRERV